MISRSDKAHRFFVPAAAVADQLLSALTNLVPALLAVRLGEAGLTIYGLAATWMVISIGLTHASVGEFLLWGARPSPRETEVPRALATACLIGGGAATVAGVSTFGTTRSWGDAAAVALLVSAVSTTVPLRNIALRERRMVTLLLADGAWLITILAVAVAGDAMNHAAPIWSWGVGALVCSLVLLIDRRDSVRLLAKPLFVRDHSGPLVADFALSSLLVQLTSLSLTFGSRPEELGGLRSGQAIIGPAGALTSALSNVHVSRRQRTSASKEDGLFLLSTVMLVWLTNGALAIVFLFWSQLGLLIFDQSWTLIRQLLPLIIVAGSLGSTASAMIAVLRRSGRTKLILTTRVRLAPLALAAPLFGAAAAGVEGLVAGRIVFHAMECLFWYRTIRLDTSLDTLSDKSGLTS